MKSVASNWNVCNEFISWNWITVKHDFFRFFAAVWLCTKTPGQFGTVGAHCAPCKLYTLIYKYTMDVCIYDNWRNAVKKNALIQRIEKHLYK